jgi:hypothetical protein
MRIDAKELRAKSLNRPPIEEQLEELTAEKKADSMSSIVDSYNVPLKR